MLMWTSAGAVTPEQVQHHGQAQQAGPEMFWLQDSKAAILQNQPGCTDELNPRIEKTLNMDNTRRMNQLIKKQKLFLDRNGYCVVENAISRTNAIKLRKRLTEQAEAESQIGKTRIHPDKKQLIAFLINKGQGFRDLLFHPEMRELVDHVLGPQYLLSSFVGHIAHPGGTKVFHTDQWWMPPPTKGNRETMLRPGVITHDYRGHHKLGEEGLNPVAIAPACVCNIMWLLDDFTAENGGTIVVPGSHLFGRQPDPKLDQEAGWKSVEAPAGSCLVLEGRVWHSTGANVTEQSRIGLTTNFCAPQFRQQENLQLGTSPKVLENASEELLDLIGFKPWCGYGSIESDFFFNTHRVTRGRYALEELKPRP